MGEIQRFHISGVEILEKNSKEKANHPPRQLLNRRSS